MKKIQATGGRMASKHKQPTPTQVKRDLKTKGFKNTGTSEKGWTLWNNASGKLLHVKGIIVRGL